MKQKNFKSRCMNELLNLLYNDIITRCSTLEDYDLYMHDTLWKLKDEFIELALDSVKSDELLEASLYKGAGYEEN